MAGMGAMFPIWTLAGAPNDSDWPVRLGQYGIFG
jgi:hypothetical protein